VAEIGVGTVAAGVAKAHADHITISGMMAAPAPVPCRRSCTRQPWKSAWPNPADPGAEQSARRVAVQADGQMKTGRDVTIGALLGADEFGFSTHRWWWKAAS